MIRLDIFDYSKNNKLDLEVTKYINKNLEVIVQVVLDLLNDNCGFDMDGFLPRNYLDTKPTECRQLVDELYEILISDVLRDYIKPKYEYLLYAIISWWEDCADDESDLIPIPLDGELKEKIENENSYRSEENENFVLRYITSYDSYYYICFSDHDFLPDSISKMVTVYLRNKDIFECFYPDTNLADYEDLMPCDLKELYKEKVGELKQDCLNNKVVDEEVGIVQVIIHILQQLEQRVVEIETRHEVEISNDIYSPMNLILKYKFGLESSREMTIGRANIKLGETDLYVYKNDINHRIEYAIIENKYIENFTTQYQQLLGYLNQNFKFGITISINKSMKLFNASKKILNSLNDIKENDKNFKITNIDAPFSDYPYVIRSTHIIPEDTTKKMNIYHLILNLYDKERKEVARKARKK